MGMQRQLVRELVVAHLPLGFCLAHFGALPIFSAGRKTCSACQVVYQLADGAGKPKLLLDDGFGLPDGIWTGVYPKKRWQIVQVARHRAPLSGRGCSARPLASQRTRNEWKPEWKPGRD